MEIENGTVTLTGSVHTNAERETIIKDVSEINGVVDIDYTLTIYEPYYTPYSLVPDRFIPDIPANDDGIQQAIELTYIWNHDLTGTEIAPFVNNGNATLTGEVDALRKKKMAEDLIRDIAGITSITNDIIVLPEDTLEDTKIASLILESLNRKSAVNVDKIDIIVEEGVVTLRGIVGSIYVKNTMYESALYTTGVKRIVNELIVTE